MVHAGAAFLEGGDRLSRSSEAREAISSAKAEVDTPEGQGPA